MKRRVTGLVVCSYLLSSPVAAAAPPTAVSPGSSSGVAHLIDQCPTFSWSAVEGAVGYELVVLGAGASPGEPPGDGGDFAAPAPSALEVTIRGAAIAWTPSAEQCLESGQRYAWSVRALEPGGSGPWAEAQLFEVSVEPSAHLEALVARLVDRVLAAREPGREDVAAAPVQPVPATTPAGELMLDSPATTGDEGAGTRALDGTGAIVAGEFIGDGSGLTGITLDGVTGSQFLRADASDEFSGLELTIAGTLDVTGILRMDEDVQKTGTSVVTNFNADLLDSVSASQFLRSDQDTLLSGDLRIREASGEGTYFTESGINRPVAGSTEFNLQNSYGDLTLRVEGSKVWHAGNDGSGTGLDADKLDGLHSSDLLRSSGTETFSSGTLTVVTGTTLEVDGTLKMDGTVTRNSTDRVTNLNADLLDGSHASAFATSGHDHDSLYVNTSGDTINDSLHSTGGYYGIHTSTNTYGIYATVVPGGIGGQFNYPGGPTTWIATGAEGLSTTHKIKTDSDLDVRGVIYNDTGIVEVEDPMEITTSSSSSPAVYAKNTSTTGADLRIGGTHAVVRADGASYTELEIWGNDDIELHLDADGSTSLPFFTEFRIMHNDSRIFKVTDQGDVYADGGYHCGSSVDPYNGSLDYDDNLDLDDLEPCLEDSSPADFAEMLPTATPGLEPGDVLVIDSAGKLTRSTLAYQPNVLGVFSTRPSYVGNSRHLGKDGYAPLAVLGIVPVKATSAAGAIRPGDLLVASSTPGHAMRCGEPQRCAGASIGKALESLREGVGRLLMMVLPQ